MQLKHRGKTVEVHLTKPEQRLLDKTGELLATIALLPCEQKGRANAAGVAIAEIAAEMKKDEQ